MDDRVLDFVRRGQAAQAAVDRLTPTPDPVEAQIAADTQADHAQARRRGVRIRDLANACVNALVAPGLLAPRHVNDARVALFSILVDDLYGSLAVDIPPLRKDTEH
jgi:hypothetical protein